MLDACFIIERECVVLDNNILYFKVFFIHAPPAAKHFVFAIFSEYIVEYMNIVLLAAGPQATAFGRIIIVLKFTIAHFHILTVAQVYMSESGIIGIGDNVVDHYSISIAHFHNVFRRFLP